MTREFFRALEIVGAPRRFAGEKLSIKEPT
jgi:hypothetical protein